MADKPLVEEVRGLASQASAAAGHATATRAAAEWRRDRDISSASSAHESATAEGDELLRRIREVCVQLVQREAAKHHHLLSKAQARAQAWPIQSADWDLEQMRSRVTSAELEARKTPFVVMNPGCLIVVLLPFWPLILWEQQIRNKKVINSWAAVFLAGREAEWWRAYHQQRCDADRQAAQTGASRSAAEAVELANASLASVIASGSGHAADLVRMAEGFAPSKWPVGAGWQPPTHPPAAIHVGRMVSNVDANLALPCYLGFAQGRSLMIETWESRLGALRGVTDVAFRLLSALPPGQARFVLCDPVGLGDSVAEFMRLADIDPHLIGGRSWSDQQHVEARLGELTEQIETIIQQRLQGRFKNVEEYNAQAAVPEPYRFLVLLDVPANLTETSWRRLLSIAENGPRCGVYALVSVNVSAVLPHGANPKDLERVCDVLVMEGQELRSLDPAYSMFRVELTARPPSATVDQMLEAVGAASLAAANVEVPFSAIAPLPGEIWAATAAKGLALSLGPAGGRRLQQLSLGEGLQVHGLIVGQTGSGKSTLLHTIITNAALNYSPEEVALYLVDFKKGVEFKLYADHQLPHARVIAIAAEREFGVSVLDALDHELTSRSEAFKNLTDKNLSSYRTSGGHLPRILAVIDEFQEFFAEDDQLAAHAHQVLDRLARQGRSFGIHLVLSSQTLAGQHSLNRSTMEQMKVRIALRCSEADSRLILAEDNPAARLLTRPGAAIYNDANGLIEGNREFQVARLTEEAAHQFLHHVSATAVSRPGTSRPQPIVFDGNVLSRVETNQNLATAVRTGQAPSGTKGLLAWLGEPTAIQPHVAASFRRRSASNLAIVGQVPDIGAAMLQLAMVAISGQAPSAVFTVLDFGDSDEPESAMFAAVAAGLPSPALLGRRRELGDLIADLAGEVKRRVEQSHVGAPTRLLVINALHRARDLRAGDQGLAFGVFADESPPNPSQLLASILSDGPEVGVHTILWCDTATNFARVINRNLAREFTMRLVFQMSAEDSANLIDSAAGARLGPNRALFFDENDGTLTKIRPYAPPDPAWFKNELATLRSR